MARDKCNPITLLSAVVTRLRSQLSLDESACFLSLTPRVKLRSPADLTIVVSPMGGPFDQGAMDGGGREQVTTNAGVAVTIRSYLQLDEAGHDSESLTHSSLGVMQAATNVLDALTIWDPDDGSGNKLLRDQMMPRAFDYDKQGRTEMLCEIQFDTNFDWDLSA